MIVLATNDDGIDAPGLKRLVREIHERGHEVYVVAPKNPQSGMGKSMRMRAEYGEADYPWARKAWWVDSTPASAVYLALHHLLSEKPDVIVSGINRGPNIGLEDLFTSGTVGAAIEGALNGIPSLAVSLATDKGLTEDEYSPAAWAAAELLQHLRSLRPGMLVNLNVPEKPRGVMATRLAWNNYKLRLVGVGGRFEPASHSFRDRYWDTVEGSDVWAVLNGYISLTVIDLEAVRRSSVDLKVAEEILEKIRGRLESRIRVQPRSSSEASV